MGYRHGSAMWFVREIKVVSKVTLVMDVGVPTTDLADDAIELMRVDLP